MARRRSRFLKDDNIDFSKLDPGLEPSGALKPKVALFADRVLNIIKLILGICLLAFVYSSSVGFFQEFSAVEKLLQVSFWSGIISFILVYLFIFEPVKIYQKGQRLLGVIFKFFAPFLKVAPYLLPVYTIIIFCLFPLFKLIFSSKDISGYFLFFIGFSLALHLVFSAKSLRYRQGDFLKANYLFGFSLVYIINVILIAFCLNLILEKFSFINFSNRSFLIAKSIFDVVFKQLFLRSI